MRQCPYLLFYQLVGYFAIASSLLSIPSWESQYHDDMFNLTGVRLSFAF